MFKIITVFILSIVGLFANAPFYQNFSFNTNIKDIDLTSYTQVNGFKYGISEGFIFEKDTVYENEPVKLILSFTEAGNLNMFFFYKEENKFQNNMKISEESKFGKGRIFFNGENKEFNLNEEEAFQKEITSKELNFYDGGENAFKVSATYVINDKKGEPHFAVTKMKQCVSKMKHKDCVSCEYIEGHDTNINCVTNIIYHKLF